MKTPLTQASEAGHKKAWMRYDWIAHWVTTEDKQTCCPHCHAKTTTRCEKCKIGLYVKCFKDYHTQ